MTSAILKIMLRLKLKQRSPAKSLLYCCLISGNNRSWTNKGWISPRHAPINTAFRTRSDQRMRLDVHPVTDGAETDTRRRFDRLKLKRISAPCAPSTPQNGLIAIVVPRIECSKLERLVPKRRVNRKADHAVGPFFPPHLVPSAYTGWRCFDSWIKSTV